MSDATARLYPDVIAAGGLGNALRAALEGAGSRLRVSELDGAVNFVAYACVESHSRFSQVFIAAEERLFLFDCWDHGVMLVSGSAPSLDDVARTIDRWVGTHCTTESLSTEFPFVSRTSHAGVYERGEEVEATWRRRLADIGEELPELVEFVQAAAARPELRQLFPYTSHNYFCFSRCTGYPFTRDTPTVRPLGDGFYLVFGPGPYERMLGWGSADVAVDLVIRNLPAGCGPAVAGTAEDLARLSRRRSAP